MGMRYERYDIPDDETHVCLNCRYCDLVVGKDEKSTPICRHPDNDGNRVWSKHGCCVNWRDDT